MTLIGFILFAAASASASYGFDRLLDILFLPITVLRLLPIRFLRPPASWRRRPRSSRPLQGTHIFDILGYNKHHGMGPTAFIRSAVFNVAGYDWVIFFYPDGFTDESAGGGFDFVSAYLRLLNTNRGKVRASCDLRLVNPTTNTATSVHPTLVTMMREYDPDGDKNKVFNCMCIGRAELEGTYVKNDRLTMECVVNVRKEPKVSKSRIFPSIKVPPSNLKRQLADLLESKEGSDVTFSVGGETVAAHRVVLAMRAPVFKAELYGPMREVGKEAIVIEDMQPDVFRAMLCFIYTDSMDRSDDLGRDYHCGNCDMVRHLLVAADRYAIERLKLTRLVRRCELEASSATYLHDDDMVAIVCVPGIMVPRREPEPDLTRHIGELLVSMEGADVTFHVDGEEFVAHRVILAARSPVFEAELYGPPATMEMDMVRVEVDDMRDWYRALAPATERYAMDRLKVVCEHNLATLPGSIVWKP
ncbi:hypothetical protein HU200_039933 [Digitaria exilis]|uniref:Uncharacterized protein n=1 Tax=Digitaria exilis TaxID=1010633 RepID=A0A835EGY8_9POAL|nr:hypothetical protein HU200_039933 [Digitaria exilis]